MLPPIALACDEAYLMPLSVTLRSLTESNADHWPLTVYVLNDAVSNPGRVLAESAVPPGSCEFVWKSVSTKGFSRFATLPRISRMTFARFLLPTVLPEQVDDVLYLDTDVLVLQDLGGLPAARALGSPVAAVRDAIDTTLHKVGSKAVGVPKVRTYFNAGVLRIDLVAWRRMDVSERALAFLVANPTTPFADQDALNVACDGNWAELDARWNWQDHRSVDFRALPRGQWPAIVHFVTEAKPWRADIPNPYADLFDEFRQRTPFARTPRERLRDRALAVRAAVSLTLRSEPALRWLVALARRARHGAAGRGS